MIRTGANCDRRTDSPGAPGVRHGGDQRTESRNARRLAQLEQQDRRRLAGLIHDHLQQLLVGAKLHAGMLRRQMLDETLQAEMEQVIGLLDEAIDASRELTAELAPPVLYRAGLIAALQWLAHQMEEKYRLRVTVDADEGAEPAAEETRVLLFQAARELLNNVVRHAQVDRAKITVTRGDSDTVRIVVADEGVGFAPEDIPVRGTGGVGLWSIRERLEWIQGGLDLAASPGCGTCATIVAPRGEPRRDS